MNKKGVTLLALCFLFIISGVSATVIINEVELNPLGTDSGNEWIEIFSDSSVDLVNWSIVNSAGKNMSFNCSFTTYCTIITKYQLLSNDKQQISIFDNENNLVDVTDVISDSLNNENSWQECFGEWKFLKSTKDEENTCEEAVQEENKPVDSTEKNIVTNSNEPEDTKEVKSKKAKNKSVIVVSFNTTENMTPKTTPNVNVTQENQIIRLGSDYERPAIVTGKVIYESKNEIIKKYSLYVFLVLVILLCLFVIFGNQD